MRGITYATGGLGVLLGTIVFTTGWSGGLVGVLPGLLIVAAFYVGGSAAWLARTIENWQAERARRELGLEPTPWMLPVGLVVALWLIGWMLILIVAGMVVYALMGTDRTQTAYEHTVYPVWSALSAVIVVLGTPSLSTSGETLTIEESMTLRARTEPRRDVGVEHERSQSFG